MSGGCGIETGNAGFPPDVQQSQIRRSLTLFQPPDPDDAGGVRMIGAGQKSFVFDDMATMVPSDIEAFTTPGEAVFYRFLQSCAQPDEAYTAWYQPDIKGQEPDFILYAKDAGLVIFEVKDWSLDQILSADPQQFKLLIGGREEIRKNPLRQAREYFGNLMDKIRRDGHLVSKEPKTYDQVKVPVNSAVVFTNINKFEYEEKGLNNVIPSDRIFFWDDLHTQSPVCSDPSGHKFREALHRMLEIKSRFTITVREFDWLRQVIFPEVRIALPKRAAGKPGIPPARRLELLDHHQESIARQFDGGQRIIAGPSGNGKTLILVHRAALLKKYNPAVRNILFVCYNITLVNYIRRLLAEKHVPLGEGGVEVCHFFQLCSRITGEEIPYEKEDSEFYSLVVQDALEKAPSCGLLYDAVLIDEGQDFSDDMLKVVTALLNPKTNHLAVALDDNQDIYERQASWKDAGIHPHSRVHRVFWIYRNTQEIVEFAEKIVEDKRKQPQDAFPKAMFPENFEPWHGPQPEIRQFPDYQTIAGWVADRIQILNSEDTCPLSEIAIIYTMRSPQDDPAMHLPRLLGTALERKGLLYNWVSEDYRAKSSYDVTTDRVAISTVHSLKGFDYSAVFVLGLDWLSPEERWTEEQIRKMAYVAITRAREQLFIPYCRENEVVRRILS